MAWVQLVEGRKRERERNPLHHSPGERKRERERMLAVHTPQQTKERGSNVVEEGGEELGQGGLPPTAAEPTFSEPTGAS